MKLTSSWEVEDTFFGAILGAFLGTFIDVLPIQQVILVVFFIVLFPMTLRKAELISRYAVIIGIIFHIIWMALLIFDLNSQSIISLDRGLILILIFLGWLISISARILYQPK